jgi:hypothetical protein
MPLSCYGGAKLTDERLASKVHCVDDEIIGGLKRRQQRGRVIIFENVCEQSPYVCELVHYAREPRLHVALPPRARQQRDGAQLDDDDARRHGGGQRLSDDAPAPDASVLVPSEVLPFFVIKRTERYHASETRGSQASSALHSAHTDGFLEGASNIFDLKNSAPNRSSFFNRGRLRTGATGGHRLRHYEVARSIVLIAS